MRRKKSICHRTAFIVHYNLFCRVQRFKINLKCALSHESLYIFAAHHTEMCIIETLKEKKYCVYHIIMNHVIIQKRTLMTFSRVKQRRRRSREEKKLIFNLWCVLFNSSNNNYRGDDRWWITSHYGAHFCSEMTLKSHGNTFFYVYAHIR